MNATTITQNHRHKTGYISLQHRNIIFIAAPHKNSHCFLPIIKCNANAFGIFYNVRIRHDTVIEGYPKTERKDAADGYWLLDYDASAKLIKESFYSNENVLSHYGTYEYNDAGELVKYSSYSAEGSLIGYYIYEGADEHGNVTQCWYNASGSLEAREVTTPKNELLCYDSEGTLLKKIIRNSDGSWNKEIFYNSDGTVREEIEH